MSIGLYDLDLATYVPIAFNLEIMKLAAYYKRKGEIVSLSPTFSPERHKLFILRKDYNDGNFPEYLLTTPNLQYGGLAFSNDVYQPMDLDIERIKPDPSVYKNTHARYINGPGTMREKEKIFKNLMEAEHCRLSLDGKNIWSEYGRQFKNLKTARNLIIHDYNPNAIDGCCEELTRIMARARNDGWATRLGMKFPPICSNGEDLLKWCAFKPNSTFYSLQYDGIIEDDAFHEFIGKNKEKSVYAQFDYYITRNTSCKNHLTIDELLRIYRQVIISRSYHIFFSLKYDEGFFLDKRWEKVIDLINLYHNSLKDFALYDYLKKIPEDTMYDFVTKVYEVLPPPLRKIYMSKPEIREIFAFVREEAYELFVMFYELNAKALEGEIK